MVSVAPPARHDAARRHAMQRLLALSALAGCAQAPLDPAEAERRARAFATPVLSLVGGFLAPTVPALGAQARPGTGMYVKLQLPTVLALRWPELLVADLGLQRLWRADLMAQTLTPIPGAPVGPATRLALGPDLSAWVLDPAARRVLRFARSGALMQTWRTGDDAPAPNAIAPLDGGVTLLVGDGTLGQWVELRSGGALALPVRPAAGDGPPARVDALAAGRDAVFVLDRLAAVVHRVGRDGRIADSLPAPELAQAASIEVDRWDRVYALDAQGRHLTLLRKGVPPQRVGADEFELQHLGGLALDGRQLAVSDRLLGQVRLFTVKEPA